MNTLDFSWPDDVNAALTALPEGHEFTVPEVLFAKITDDQREEWQEKFAGVRN
jgi:methionyl-tRNA synthetase